MLVNLFIGGKMTDPPQFLYRDVSFHPPEADRLADKIAEYIRKLMSEKSSIDTRVNNLNSDWEGYQKEIFISGVNPHQKKTIDLIEYLGRQKQFFHNLRVTRREAYTNPAWEACEKTKR
jgi:uncharacterized protein YukE